ncbi:hypothetical protein BaOVIS_029100 [Babesia ovis]|uniref:DNA primase large subunit C-terminal domain-containing protein n=1 Tax=Babesia ovis TaxID=5869 RepID=A0A9W5TDN3_BABOV|nr:hypothetical protein BaOVIS_029100 [Babesia ovis]
MEICRCLGVKAITVYAFSLQNFQRSETEVCNLMSLATKTAETDEKLSQYRKDGAFLLRFHGDFRFLMEELRVALDDVERENAKAYAASRYNMSKSGTIVNLCISYGARNEIAIAKEGFRKKDNWNEEEVAEQFYKCLVAGDHCPPQIMIRTSGVTRLSDFLLYQAPFYPDAMSLVRHRQVALKNGDAYVPNTVLHVLCSSRFRQQVQGSLRSLDEAGAIDSAKPFLDERISGFLRVLPESYLAVDYTRSTYVPGGEENLSLANINSVFKSTFPPCMRRIFTHYVNSHHLKHNARRQFWLFLKGCGMSLEENLHFNRNIWHDAASFDKEHVYNIRHIYGKEGRRLSYPPLSCNAIIRSLPPPAAGQVHGCPFKDLDTAGMRKLLEDFGLSDNQISPIMDLKSTHQYQLACVEYFTQTTPAGSSTEGVGIHPNVFFQNSFKAHYGNKNTE